MARTGPDACPLCGCSSAEPLKEIPYAAIWTALELEWSATFSTNVREGNSPEPVTCLLQCDGCDLQYFSPLSAGDQAFYGELMVQVRYEAWRWEFDIVSSLLGGEESVLDLGCGEGVFLRQLSPRRRPLVGVDSNPSSARLPEQAGIEFVRGTIEEFAASRSDLFDVVCAFQILEHLGSVRTLVEPMLSRLREGGRLFISVPNRRRQPSRTFDSLDHPPHHLSRWHPDQLRLIASMHDMRLTSLRYQRLHPKVHRALRPVVLVTHGGLPSIALRRSPARAIQSRGRVGHTMLAEFRRRQ